MVHTIPARARCRQICSPLCVRHVSNRAILGLQFDLVSCQKEPWRVWLMCCIRHTAREEPMVQSHPTTPAQRAQSASMMIAHAGQYGIVTTLSQTLGVSRPTLYAWKAQAM